jgi:hypothetical protein
MSALRPRVIGRTYDYTGSGAEWRPTKGIHTHSWLRSQSPKTSHFFFIDFQKVHQRHIHKLDCRSPSWIPSSLMVAPSWLQLMKPLWGSMTAIARGCVDVQCRWYYMKVVATKTLPLSVLRLMSQWCCFEIWIRFMAIATDNDTPRGGSFDGEKRRIYRTKLTSNKEDFHFQLTRLQFPVCLAFAITINKSQSRRASPWPTLALTFEPLCSVIVSCMWHCPGQLCPQRFYPDPRIQCRQGHDNVMYPEALQALQW